MNILSEKVISEIYIYKSLSLQALGLFKDTLKEFKDTIEEFDKFKNREQKCMKQCYFDMKKSIYSESLFNTLYIEIEHKC